MKGKNVLPLIALLLTILVIEDATAQNGNVPTSLRSTGNARRRALHDGNRVKTTFRNDGLIGDAAFPPVCAWPVRSNPYIYDMGVFFGVERVFVDTVFFANNDTNSTTGTRLRDGRSNIPTRPGGEATNRVITVGTQLASEVRITDRLVTTHQGPRAGGYAFDQITGLFSGLQPVPNFFNPAQQSLAMSHIPNSWPPEWPDQPTYKDPTTGKAQWNGYFGQGIINADQESYFVMDDATDTRWLTLYNFRPIPEEIDRAGAGIQVKGRGLQWSNYLAQDNIFWVYDIKNISRYDYDRVVFGSIVGTAVGGAGQFQFNVSVFDQSESFTYSYNNPITAKASTWVGDVGYSGLAFLESPGNPFDGIDNDDSYGKEIRENGALGEAFSNLISKEAIIANSPSEALGKLGGQVPDQFKAVGSGDPNFVNTGYEFASVPDTAGRLVGINAPRVLKANDYLILIDQAQASPLGGNYPAGTRFTVYNRRSVQVPADGSALTVNSLGRLYTVKAGDTLREVERNTFDDNLNGVIDESFKLHFERRATGVDIINRVPIPAAPLPPLHFINYLRLARQGQTLNDGNRYPLIDERRDDGIDNNRNWGKIDDVGSNGKIGSGGIGENDNVPTAGEPNFDALDIRESDQIGLSSYVAKISNGFNQGSSNAMWNDLAPGNFPDSVKFTPADIDYLYGTGYFPLKSGQTERFSLALVYGEDARTIVNNKRIVKDIYDNNYNFVGPPKPEPTVTAIVGDNNGKPFITLTWTADGEDYFDSFVARKLSLDPTVSTADAQARARTFEGYRIYKSTDSEFLDTRTVSDADGTPAQFRKPTIQFDKIDGISGFSKITFKGVSYNLGNETGLQHTWTDSAITLGRTYFYAVVNYSKEDSTLRFYPSENQFGAFDDGRGGYLLSPNTVVVTARPYAAGTVNPNASSGNAAPNTANQGQGSVSYSVINAQKIGSDRTIEVQIVGTGADSTDNNGDGIIDDPIEKATALPSYFTVRDVTAGKTLVNRSRKYLGEAGLYGIGGYIADEESKLLDTAGIALTIKNNLTVSVDRDRSVWNRAVRDSLPFISTLTPETETGLIGGIRVRPFTSVARPADYAIVIVPPQAGRSDTITVKFRANDDTTGAFTEGTFNSTIRTNFKVLRITDPTNPASWVEQRYFVDPTPFSTGVATLGSTALTFTILEQGVKGGVPPPLDSVCSWRVAISNVTTSPQALSVGDTLFIRTNKPLLDGDRFTVDLKAVQSSQDGIRTALSKIKAYPNPYIVTNLAEPNLPSINSRGRAGRKLFFSNVPTGATVRIYSIRGELIRTLRHELDTSALEWDMRTSENLEIAYGVYLFHVDAPGIGTTTGKFAVIK